MLNISIMITLSRIILTPVVMYLLWHHQWSYGLAVFLVAAVTDLLDGFVARWLQQRTYLGQILDPVADKCLLLGTMYMLLAVVAVSYVQQLAVVFLIFKELILLSVGGYLMNRYQFFIAPSFLSRMASLAEFVMITVVLGCLIWLGVIPALWLTVMLVVSCILSAALLVRYVRLIAQFFQER